MASSDEDLIIASEFSERPASIREMRSTDALFNEICTDFLEIARIAAKTEQTTKTDEIFESLEALKQEIETALRATKTDK